MQMVQYSTVVDLETKLYGEAPKLIILSVGEGNTQVSANALNILAELVRKVPSRPQPHPQRRRADVGDCRQSALSQQLKVGFHFDFHSRASRSAAAISAGAILAAASSRASAAPSSPCAAERPNHIRAST
jgi:hypothetical protein